MAAARWGGGAIKYLFRLKNDHTGGLFAWDDTALTTATVAFADAFKLGATSGDVIVEQSQLAYDENGIPTFTFTQSRDDEEFAQFLDIAAPKKAAGGGGATRNEKVAEDGRRIGGSASSSGAQWLLLDYGSLADDGKIKVTAAVGTISRTSGGRTYQASELVMPSLEFVGTAAKQDIVIPATAFDGALVTAAAKTLAETYYAQDFFFDEP